MGFFDQIKRKYVELSYVQVQMHIMVQIKLNLILCTWVNIPI